MLERLIWKCYSSPTIDKNKLNAIKPTTDKTNTNYFFFLVTKNHKYRCTLDIKNISKPAISRVIGKTPSISFPLRPPMPITNEKKAALNTILNVKIADRTIKVRATIMAIEIGLELFTGFCI